MFKKWFSKRNTTNKSQDFSQKNIQKNTQSNKKIDFNVLETELLQADFGLELSESIITFLKRKKCQTEQDLWNQLPLFFEQIFHNAKVHEPFKTQSIVLVFGINGAGKTSFCAKLSYFLKQKNEDNLLVGADLYRAAAFEQLESTAQKHALNLHQNHHQNSSANVYDGIEKIKKTGQHLIIDTAGRLANQQNLMAELTKIVAVCEKTEITVEKWLVIDGTSGQNNLSQIQTFHEHIGIKGLVLTKTDSQSKNGAIFNAVHHFKLPIIFETFGEKINNMDYFDIQKFLKKMQEN